MLPRSRAEIIDRDGLIIWHRSLLRILCPLLLRGAVRQVRDAFIFEIRPRVRFWPMPAHLKPPLVRFGE